MLTGQSEGGRPITDPAMPGMCGQAAQLQDLQQRVCLKKQNKGQFG